MKFDCIIMNPPYSRNLHLKILAEAIKHLKDEKSVCVNLSPDSHIICPTVWNIWNDNTKYCEVTYSHMYEYNHISHEDANKMFALGNGIDALHIGVYKKAVNPNVKTHPFNETILKVCTMLQTHQPSLRNNFTRKTNLGKFGVRVYRYRSASTVYDAIICTEGRAVEGIDFKTENEKINFCNSITCWPYKFMYMCKDTNPAHLPFMSDYSQPWDDARFYKFFNITPEEQKIIEDTMAKYK